MIIMVIISVADTNATMPHISGCEQEEGNLMPQVVFFLAQLVGGVGGSLYYSLGVSYIDDNVKKSKTPALISLSYCLRLLGPAIGYSLASACLKLYISPSLNPTVSNEDPRWLGAWWVGWLVLGCVLAVFTVMLGLLKTSLEYKSQTTAPSSFQACSQKCFPEQRRESNSNRSVS